MVDSSSSATAVGRAVMDATSAATAAGCWLQRRWRLHVITVLEQKMAMISNENDDGKGDEDDKSDQYDNAN